jgi:hypothetical protein
MKKKREIKHNKGNFGRNQMRKCMKTGKGEGKFGQQETLVTERKKG